MSRSTALRDDFYSVKNDSFSVRLRPTQMSVDTLAKIFSLSTSSIFLVADDGAVATSDDDGSFNTYEMSTDVCWIVNGHGSSSSSSSACGQQAKLEKWRPATQVYVQDRRVLSLKKSSSFSKPEKKGSGSTGTGSWTKTVEVCVFDICSSTIKKTFNLPLTLTESTASVTKISDITSAEAFDGDCVVLLDSENLRIPDNIGTRGMLSSLFGY